MVIADDAQVTYRMFASGKRLTARDNLFSLRALRGGRDLKTVPALRGVSFTASEGETIGVVGHNGSGKSTLFRAISGLIPTSDGGIWVRDRPVLLGVNAALVPELSGENNIKLGLLAMGFTPSEAAARVDEIADFAELNEFIHHPMRTYSSGMGARLRFAIASAKAHSILLIDEALAVGDRRFKAKSEQRIQELRSSAGLVMIVSHSIGSLKETCDRVLWIHKGELRADGPAADVIGDYVKWTKDPGSTAVGAASTGTTKSAASAANAKKQTSNVVPPFTAGDTSPFDALVSGTSVATTRNVEASPTVAVGGSAPQVSLFDQLLSGALKTVPAPKREAREQRTRARPTRSVAVATRPIILPGESPRAAARRERYQRAAQERRHRRIVALAITGIAILIAIGAGAAITLVAVLSHTAALPGASEVSLLGETWAPGRVQVIDESPPDSTADDGLTAALDSPGAAFTLAI